MDPNEQLLAEEFTRSMRYLIVQFSSNSDIPYEGMQDFSCAEAEALADVIRLGGLPLGLAAEGQEAAAMLIGAHAAGDQYGDQHFVDANTVVTTWTPGDLIPRKWWIATARPDSRGVFLARQLPTGPHSNPTGAPVELHIAAVEPYDMEGQL